MPNLRPSQSYLQRVPIISVHNAAGRPVYSPAIGPRVRLPAVLYTAYIKAIGSETHERDETQRRKAPRTRPPRSNAFFVKQCNHRPLRAGTPPECAGPVEYRAAKGNRDATCLRAGAGRHHKPALAAGR